MNEPSERLLAYAFHNLKRHYANSALGIHIKRMQAPGTFVDIGANLGFYSLLAREAGLQSIAFEPEPALASFLDRNARVFGRTFPMALSDEPGTLPLYYSRTNSGATSLVAAEGYEESTANIPVVTFSAVALDGLLGPLGAIKLVKIDVEGNEESTSRGMVDFLDLGHRPDVWCEVRGDASGRAPGTFRAIRDLFRDFGYTMLEVATRGLPEPAPADEILAARGVFDVLFTAARPHSP